MHKIGLLAALASMLFVTAAQATPITRTFDFETDTYSTGVFHGTTAPVDPVDVSITVTFDPSVDVVAQTTGITLNSYNITLDSSQIGFDFNTGLDILLFGLTENGVGIIGPGTNDFAMQISQPESATPQFSAAQYGSGATGDIYLASDGKVSFKTVTPVPEPSSLALLLSGLAGCAFLMRRRARAC